MPWRRAGPSLLAELDQPAFVAGPNRVARVGVTVSNVGGAPAFFRGCQQAVPVIVEGAASGVWVDLLGFYTACIATLVPATLQLAPGERTHLFVEVAAGERNRLRLLFGTSASQPFGQHARTVEFAVQ